MQKEFLYGIIGLLVGVVIAGYAASNAVNTNNRGMMSMMGMRQQSISVDDDDKNKSGANMMHDMDDDEDDSMTMGGMVNSLKGQTGDNFDKAFLIGMIEHHQGAIDMANEAKVNAKHEEIKAMADDIISAQTKEIEQMKEWQKMWKYSQ